MLWIFFACATNNILVSTTKMCETRRKKHESNRNCQTHRRPRSRRHPQGDPQNHAHPRGRPDADNIDTDREFLLRDIRSVKKTRHKLCKWTNKNIKSDFYRAYSRRHRKDINSICLEKHIDKFPIMWYNRGRKSTERCL